MSYLGKTAGTTDPKMPGKSSVDLLSQRLTALRAAGMLRQREIEGVQTQWNALKTEIYRRLSAIDQHHKKKCIDEILARLELVQNEVLDAVKRDLGMLGTPPSKEDKDELESITSRSRMPTGGYGIGGGVPLSALGNRSPSPTLPKVSQPCKLDALPTPTSRDDSVESPQASPSPPRTDDWLRNTVVGTSRLNATREVNTSDHSLSVDTQIVETQETNPIVKMTELENTSKDAASDDEPTDTIKEPVGRPSRQR